MEGVAVLLDCCILEPTRLHRTRRQEELCGLSFQANTNLMYIQTNSILVESAHSIFIVRRFHSSYDKPIE